jgi:hypothetical protein
MKWRRLINPVLGLGVFILACVISPWLGVLLMVLIAVLNVASPRR